MGCTHRFLTNLLACTHLCSAVYWGISWQNVYPGALSDLVQKDICAITERAASGCFLGPPLPVSQVHERSVQSDFLLIILRDILQKRPDLRLVLMSATVDCDKFAGYFGRCPVVTIPGRTFPVQVRDHLCRRLLASGNTPVFILWSTHYYVCWSAREVCGCIECLSSMK